MAQILVVEDEISNQDIITRMLEFRGHTVMLASNGREALEMAEQNPPDVILMDLAMPVMDGWTTTSRFKSQPRLAQIPIIAVTCYDSDGDIGHALEVGCARALAKPIDFYALIDMVETTVAHLP
jgi:two-component system, cell cycle response regulator DivK